MRRGTFEWMKSVNRSIILNRIRTESPISRAQIAKDTKLTPPTVSSNVKALIEQGLVIESVLGESQGGRKPTMLLINNEAFYVIGVDVGPQEIDYVIADLAGNIVTRTERKLPTPITNSEFLVILKEGVNAVITDTTIELEKIIGIGVAMHGVVEVETGTSLFAPNLGLTNIPIKEELEKEFELEVKVENDARAMALGESWFGNHGELDSMLVVNLGRGVGAGLVINGRLYHGAQNIAGEIGHMTIDINGAICECGNRGCLQTFATGSAITKQARKVLKEHPIKDIEASSITGEKVYEMALAGNQDFVKILENTGGILGIGLTNLIHIINPNKIVLGGGVTKSGKYILPAVQTAIEQRALTPKSKMTEVTLSELGEDATIIGAIALLLEDLFDPV
ncbi:ROK family transcriptional regulator [Sporosarcina sp. G11-34]|uniref:ROK family transcriptional regulator n=1 Tax=Sporosarcina sp. G11-34 TaxID=2849605 RepID=UPI0022A8E6D8|nr:ROK family transcriptional regulator [Sporosarcina sp. G11-34]MCZ2258473.1 ROK family transcriptional regulator [Sporosarcina sp. G11-34]